MVVSAKRSPACVRVFTHICCLTCVVDAAQVHWFSIVNSLLIVLFLTAMIAMILIRNLHRDIMRYNRVPTDEEKAEEREETGWKVSYIFLRALVLRGRKRWSPREYLCHLETSGFLADQGGIAGLTTVFITHALW